MITYLRSSSYNCHDDCEQRFFIEYILGWRGLSNLAADKGTIVHKVLETLANIKLCEQNNIDIYFNKYSGEIRINKFNIDKIIEKIFGYYVKILTNHNWTESIYTDCKELVYKAIKLNDGMFNPLNRIIVKPEVSFDFNIESEWAKYNFDNISGYLALKGTIDLVTDLGNNTYEIIDWKTGKRINWATGQEKNHKTLQDDPQLRMYHYAAKKIYPNIEQIIVTIFYIKDGGPFSICFTDEDLPKTEDMLKKKFEIIKNLKTPKLTRSWKCNKLCHAGMTTFDKPMQEFRGGQITPIGQFMSKCEQIKFEITKKGIDKVKIEYTKPNHHIDNYDSPGDIK